MMTRPGENWRFVALLSRRPWQMGDGGMGDGGVAGLDWISRCALFFPGATKDSSNWTDLRQVDRLIDPGSG